MAVGWVGMGECDQQDPCSRQQQGAFQERGAPRGQLAMPGESLLLPARADRGTLQKGAEALVKGEAARKAGMGEGDGEVGGAHAM